MFRRATKCKSAPYTLNIMRQIIVGTRSTALALAQARTVLSQLKEAWPDNDFKLQVVPGPEDDPIKGVANLQEALLVKRVDIAVHRLKDLSVDENDDLEVAAVTKRVEAREALCVRAEHPKMLAGLPSGAVIGTSGQLRLALLKNFRPDFVFKDVQGSIDDRLALLGECDAIILGAASLIHLELRNRIDELIDPDILMPPPGQGALALQTRFDDDIAIELCYSLHHHDTDDRTIAERSFYKGIDKKFPAGSLATIGKDGVLTLTGCIVSTDGSKIIRASIEGDQDEAEELGFELAEDILLQNNKENL